MLENELQRRRKRAGSWRKLANEIGTDHAYLYRVSKGEKQPGDTLLEALGLERVVTYRRKRS